VELHFEGLV